MSIFSGNKDTDILILTKLNYNDLLAVCEAYKRSYHIDLCENNSLWYVLIKRDFPKRAKNILYKEYLETYKTNPRQFYQIINRKSKVVEIPEIKRIHDKIYDNFHKISRRNQKLMLMVNKLFSEHSKNYPLVRGDIVSFEVLKKGMIWDGEKLILLYDNAIPKEIKFPEFPLDHFSDVFQEYSISIDEEKIDEIKKNYNSANNTSFVTDENKIYRIKVTPREGTEDLDFFKEIYVNKGTYNIDYYGL